MSGTPCFIGVLAALLPYYTYVCACATRFAVWSVCVMRVVCVSKDGAPLQTGANGIGWVYVWCYGLPPMIT